MSNNDLDLYQNEGYAFLEELTENISITSEIEFLKETEGLDEDGNKKTMISINVTIPDDESREPIAKFITEEATVFYAIMPDGISMIDILFDSNTDYDYLQFSKVCEEYFDNLSVANIYGTELPILTVTISPADDFSTFLTALKASWSYIPSTAEKTCSGIRITCQTENLLFAQLDKGTVTTIYDALT